jgi:hypothetical protein
VNCRWNEEKVFPSLFETLDKGFVEARLHTDGDRGEELSDYQQRVAGSLATPYYRVMEPRSGTILDGSESGIVSVDGFRKFLERAQQSRRGEEKVGRLEQR